MARGLGALRIRSEDYRQKRRDTLVNWGSTQYSSRIHTVLNPAHAVRLAADKLKALQAFTDGDVPRPEWTTQESVARQWLAEGSKVVARALLNSHSGRGIIVVKPGETLPYAPLYTKYFKKEAEYRVHVAKQGIFDYAQKKLRNGTTENPAHSPYIRNHDNGWVFARCDIHPPDKVLYTATHALDMLGLDFGAADIAVRGDKCVIFEMNTAPGLEGSTLNKYIDAIRQMCYSVNRR